MSQYQTDRLSKNDKGRITLQPSPEAYCALGDKGYSAIVVEGKFIIMPVGDSHIHPLEAYRNKGYSHAISFEANKDDAWGALPSFCINEIEVEEDEDGYFVIDLGPIYLLPWPGKNEYTLRHAVDNLIMRLDSCSNTEEAMAAAKLVPEYVKAHIKPTEWHEVFKSRGFMK